MLQYIQRGAPPAGQLVRRQRGFSWSCYTLIRVNTVWLNNNNNNISIDKAKEEYHLKAIGETSTLNSCWEIQVVFRLYDRASNPCWLSLLSQCSACQCDIQYKVIVHLGGSSGFHWPWIVLHCQLLGAPAHYISIFSNSHLADISAHGHSHLLCAVFEYGTWKKAIAMFSQGECPVKFCLSTVINLTVEATTLILHTTVDHVIALFQPKSASIGTPEFSLVLLSPVLIWFIPCSIGTFSVLIC